jgi:hypothetical protein
MADKPVYMLFLGGPLHGKTLAVPDPKLPYYCDEPLRPWKFDPWGGEAASITPAFRTRRYRPGTITVGFHRNGETHIIVNHDVMICEPEPEDKTHA